MSDLKHILLEYGVRQRDLAKAAGRSAGRVSQWCSGDGKIPAEVVPAIERETGIPRHVLRPDLWQAA